MTLEKITLNFPSLNLLWAFVRDAKINYIEVNTGKISLDCNCNPADVQLAKEKYSASE